MILFLIIAVICLPAFLAVYVGSFYGVYLFGKVTVEGWNSDAPLWRKLAASTIVVPLTALFAWFAYIVTFKMIPGLVAPFIG